LPRKLYTLPFISTVAVNSSKSDAQTARIGASNS
jgi:hypothetical protein